MSIKILQWNVWDKENPNYIAKQIKRLDVDIVCAQELIQEFKKKIDTAKYIARKIGYDYFFKEADTWSNRVEKETQGNAIFSRLPIVSKLYQYLQKPKHNPPDASHEGRVYLELGIKWNSQILTIGTAHLSYSHRFVITKHRKKEINNLVDIIKSKKSNYIFAGDLNSTPDSYTINKLTEYLKNAGPNFNKKSWTTKPFDYEGFKENELNWRLDYIFVTKDIVVKKAKIIKTPYSDHLPILIEIES